jgi:hypothetical protein
MFTWLTFWFKDSRHRGNSRLTAQWNRLCTWRTLGNRILKEFLELKSPFKYAHSPSPPVVYFLQSVVKKLTLLVLRGMPSFTCLVFRCKSLKEPSNVVCDTELDLGVEVTSTFHCWCLYRSWDLKHYRLVQSLLEWQSYQCLGYHRNYRRVDHSHHFRHVVYL